MAAARPAPQGLALVASRHWSRVARCSRCTSGRQRRSLRPIRPARRTRRRPGLGQRDAAGRRYWLARFSGRSAAAATGRDRAREQSRLARRGAERGAGAGAIPDPARRAVSADRRRSPVRRLSRTPASLSSDAASATVAHDYSVGLSAAWEIDFFGRLRSLNDQALQQYFATAQARKAVEILLVSAGRRPVPDAARGRRTARGDATDTRDARRRPTSS